MILQASNIFKKYDSLEVLKGIDLTVNKGEIIAIVGSSGAGKSTLLHILGTLDKPDNGSLVINNKNVSTLSEKQLAIFRNKEMGFVFQFHHLLPEFTALENIMLPSLIADEKKSVAKKKAMELLNLLGLKGRAEHKPNQLSGGEAQRVAICRALINNPSIILADEPSGNLDSENALALHKLFLQLRTELDQTFIIVTHHEQLANMVDRVIKMKDGKIEKDIIA